MSVGVPPDDPREYLVAKARAALAEDPRVAELGLEINIRGDKVFVSGVVPTGERSAAVSQVLERTFPDRDVVNETELAEDFVDEGSEELK